MGKLTGRSPILTADVDEDLLIHVVDTSGTPASFKATLSQLYAVFPKNSSAGASDVDYVARWTAEDELGKGVIQDDGSRVGIDTAPDAVYKLNVNGGAMALGHPLGATGAKLMTTLLHELERRDAKFGLQAICEGGGTANATIIERI